MVAAASLMPPFGIGATRLLVMGLIEPLVAVALGILFLGETMTGWTLAGGICVIVSVATVLDLFRRSDRVATL